jgi:hypothetical protein
VTPDKPEVHAMASLLNIDCDAVVGKLLRFWIWCDAQSVAGVSLGVSKAFLDRLCHQPGFADALITVDWLRVRSGSLEVPRFDQHNGQTAKARAMDARKKANKRKRDKCPDDEGTKVPIEKGQKPDQRREEKKGIVTNTILKTNKNDLPFPDDAFLQAWEAWEEYRKQRKLKTTDQTVAALFKKFALWGCEKSVVAIWKSIECGWQGIFEPKDPDCQRTTKPPAPFKGIVENIELKML